MVPGNKSASVGTEVGFFLVKEHAYPTPPIILWLPLSTAASERGIALRAYQNLAHAPRAARMAGEYCQLN